MSGSHEDRWETEARLQERIAKLQSELAAAREKALEEAASVARANHDNMIRYRNDSQAEELNGKKGDLFTWTSMHAYAAAVANDIVRDIRALLPPPQTKAPEG